MPLVNPNLVDVRYDPEDGLIGQWMAWSSMIPIFLVAGFVAILAVKRELQFIAFFATLLGSEVLNLVMKHSIKQPRPLGSYMTGYGMPSSHSQFMAFTVTYALLHLWRCGFGASRAIRGCISLALAASLFSVGSSRIYLGVHSIQQVLAGVAVGAVLAFVSDVFVQKGLAPHVFPALESHRIGRSLQLRDSSMIPNVAHVEHQAYLLLKQQHLASIKRD